METTQENAMETRVCMNCAESNPPEATQCRNCNATLRSRITGSIDRPSIGESVANTTTRIGRLLVKNVISVFSKETIERILSLLVFQNSCWKQLDDDVGKQAKNIDVLRLFVYVALFQFVGGILRHGFPSSFLIFLALVLFSAIGYGVNIGWWVLMTKWLGILVRNSTTGICDRLIREMGNVLFITIGIGALATIIPLKTIGTICIFIGLAFGLSIVARVIKKHGKIETWTIKYIVGGYSIGFVVIWAVGVGVLMFFEGFALALL